MVEMDAYNISYDEVWRLSRPDKFITKEIMLSRISTLLACILVKLGSCEEDSISLSKHEAWSATIYLAKIHA